MPVRVFFAAIPLSLLSDVDCAKVRAGDTRGAPNEWRLFAARNLNRLEKKGEPALHHDASARPICRCLGKELTSGKKSQQPPFHAAAADPDA